MRYDVIVLGGGFIGANCAYELAKNNLDVLLLEKRRFGSGASGSSAAMLELQIDAHRGEPFFSLAKASHDLFPSLYQEIKDLTDVDFQFERCGILQLALSDEETDQLKRESERQKKMGLVAEWQTPEELADQLPLAEDLAKGGVYFGNDGQVNGERFLQALLKACKISGVALREGMNSFQIKPINNFVRIQTQEETFEAPFLVVAAGTWSDEIFITFGTRLGITPVRGQLVIYDTPRPLFRYPIYTKTGGYVTPKKDGTTFVGTTVEEAGYDEFPTKAGKTEIIENIVKLFPLFAHLPVRGQCAGLRPKSADGLPFLGPLVTQKNVIAATGHYRNGVLLAPITARLVSEMVLWKKPSQEIFPFSPQRIFAIKTP